MRGLNFDRGLAWKGHSDRLFWPAFGNTGFLIDLDYGSPLYDSPAPTTLSSAIRMC